MDDISFPLEVEEYVSLLMKEGSYTYSKILSESLHKFESKYSDSVIKETVMYKYLFDITGNIYEI